MSSTFIVTGQAGPKRLLATALSTAMLSTAASALAEANTATTADDAAASADIDSHKPNELEGAIVEGHAINEPASPKFTASLLDTPRAVTVLPATLIDDIGVVDLVDALRLIPGITFGAGEGGNPQGDRPYLRGYDAQGSVFVDGVRDVGAQSRETFDIQQIEVVKGPDSVYSGRSNGGGSINLVSKSPVADNFTQLGLDLGSASLKRVTIDSNLMLGDNAALRIDLPAEPDQQDVLRGGVSGAFRDRGTRTFADVVGEPEVLSERSLRPSRADSALAKRGYFGTGGSRDTSQRCHNIAPPFFCRSAGRRDAFRAIASRLPALLPSKDSPKE